jgi:hypothetical protein
MRGKTGVWGDYTHEKFLALCPYGAPGDRLWVRETWALDPGSHPDDREVLYRATDPGWDDNGTGLKWRPSILMPRWASRITLEITDVRVERVQDISDADIRAEGVTAEAVRDLAGPTVKIGFTSTNGARDPRGLIEVPVGALDPRQLWQLGWTAINGAESWDANPWLWCLTFRRMP